MGRKDKRGILFSGSWRNKELLVRGSLKGSLDLQLFRGSVNGRQFITQSQHTRKDNLP